MFLNTLKRFENNKLIHPPSWLIENTVFLSQMGSVAYGCSQNTSDIDIYGFCLPPMGLTFPWTVGEIPGFGTQVQRFHQWQEHHIQDKSAGKEYDITVYGLVRYVQLCMENNPNMIDSLFVPRRCILHSTRLAELLREHRKLFLHKGSLFKLRAYAYSQLSKIENKSNSSNPKRQADVAEHGFDTKFSMHLVRLILQAEQILNEHDLDLERNREILKSIRRGEWELERLKEYFYAKEKALEEAYAKSTLRECPDEAAIKSLLIKCLEHHYGSLDKLFPTQNKSIELLRDLEALISKYR